MTQPNKNYLRFAGTDSGVRLLKTYPLDKTGVWRIWSEDDVGAASKELSIVTGKLADVILYGTNLPKFWGWGSGGRFEYLGDSLLHVDQDSLALRATLEQELADLEQKTSELKKKLGK